MVPPGAIRLAETASVGVGRQVERMKNMFNAKEDEAPIAPVLQGAKKWGAVKNVVSTTQVTAQR